MPRRKEVLEMIKKGIENDAEYYSGKPFSGKNVAEYFGKQGAAISALAGIIKTLLPEEE